jgi:signal transduction histidine kinase
MIGRPPSPELDRIVVLNVNDREAARYMIGRMLRTGGFVALEAGTGEDALEIAQRERPSVIVLDIQLPGIDGLEVCRRLKANPQTASIAVLQTSATYIGTETKVRGLEIGADGFLVQPFTSQELIATVNSLVRLKQRELTQQVRAEALVEADKRKDDYLAMLAHELRNPVAAITSALELIDEYECRDERERRAREVGRRQVRVLAHLVDDLLDMSRVTRGLIVLKRAPLDVVALLRLAARAAQAGSMARRGQELTVQLPETPLVVHGDATRLQQIFTNLLDNASKYTDPGGHIELLVDDVEVAPDGDGQSGRHVRVRIRDDGMGIPADALPNLFRLFYQAHASIARSSGGLGIGLTLVRTLTELHDGQVSARSDGPDQGSEFEVRLPLLDARAAEAVARRADGDGVPHARKATRAQRKRVLIVEDNDDNREMLADVCRRWGHEVITAADGFEGVRLATEELPDVALIDLGLPGIDGYEVARRLHASPATASIRLVALSGYAAREDAESAFHVHIVKPADPQRLATILNEPAHQP